jgi:hypothetical protein
MTAYHHTSIHRDEETAAKEKSAACVGGGAIATNRGLQLH